MDVGGDKPDSNLNLGDDRPNPSKNSFDLDNNYVDIGKAELSCQDTELVPGRAQSNSEGDILDPGGDGQDLRGSSLVPGGDMLEP